MPPRLEPDGSHLQAPTRPSRVRPPRGNGGEIPEKPTWGVPVRFPARGPISAVAARWACTLPSSLVADLTRVLAPVVAV